MQLGWASSLTASLEWKHLLAWPPKGCSVAFSKCPLSCNLQGGQAVLSSPLFFRVCLVDEKVWFLVLYYISLLFDK